MAVSIQCRSVRRASGKIFIRWSDKTEQEFDSLEQIKDYVRERVQGDAAKDFLRAVAILKALRSTPDMSGAAAALESRTMTLDESLAANMVRFT